MIDGSEKCNRQLAFELQNSQVWEKRSNVHSQKRVNGNQPLSTVSKHLLLGLPLKICRTK